MSEAKRDENHITTILGVSSVDGVTPVVIWADPTTHRLLVDMSGATTSGVGAPSSTPSSLGMIYVDTNATKVYISTGTTNSSNWTIVN